MKRYLKHIFLALTATLMAVSCLEELEIETPTFGDEVVTLVPRVQSFANRYVTKAEYADNETIISKYTVLVFNNAGNLVLNGVHVEGAPIADGGYPNYAVYTSGKLVVEEGTTITSDRGALYMSNGADVTINGGNISVTDALGTRALTAHVIYAYGSTSKLTINDGNFALNYKAAEDLGASVICPAGATIKVFDGDFRYYGVQGGQSGIFQNYMGDGAPVDVYGGTFNDNTVTKSGNIAAGYNVIETEVDGVKYYSVVPEGVENPIVTASQLKALGETTTVSGTYNLLADIDMSGYDMKPITVSGENSELIFNGNGHTIKNLNLVNSTINVPVAGLFTTNHIAKKLTVSDLKIVNATSNSNNFSSVVFAYNSDGCEVNLINVDVEGATIEGKTASALVGYTTNNVKLTNCDVNNITMTGESERPDKIGAFVGTAHGANCTVTVSNCTNNTEYNEAGRVINGATMTIDGMQYVAKQ